ncbi:TraR/DksA C4-type zinc finger protein [Fulvimarina sp. MAC8]|uniref:TraR/DksA family transcriptional regulator n=1 Tax=Fulvimarina sp. MAC8 TaxID=3162874 RepID=UPI0032EC0A3F
MTTPSEDGIDTDKFQKRLETELEELTTLSEDASENRAPVELDQQSVGRLSRMDAMQVQQMAQAVERRRRDRIQKIRRALARIEDGDYGYCHECDEPIASGRLEIDPAAHLCVNCA